LARPVGERSFSHRLGLHAKLDRSSRRGVLAGKVCAASAPAAASAGDEARMRTAFRAFLLGGLLVAVVVLGYLYWERQRNTVEIKFPAITIETH
jgi:hypothetical protein